MFYDNFINLCAQKGVSQAEVARKIGISGAAISKYKTGGMPSDITMVKIADYFDVTVEYLKEGTQTKNTTPVEDKDGLTEKDYKDIAKSLDRVLGELEGGSSDALMFDGEPLDDETWELLRISLENSIKMSKIIAKQRNTKKNHSKKNN